VRRELRPYLALALSIVLFDQITKSIIRITFLHGESKQVLGDFLRFCFVYNQGGAFGVKIGNYLFYTVLAISVAILATIYLFKSNIQHRRDMVFLALVIGGAIGNLIDRIFLGKVVDFIDIDIIDIVIPSFSFLFFKFKGFELYRWFTFNIADAAVTVGLLGLIFHIILKDNPSRKTLQA
jgi:signal peptidase II